MNQDNVVAGLLGLHAILNGGRLLNCWGLLLEIVASVYVYFGLEWYIRQPGLNTADEFCLNGGLVLPGVQIIGGFCVEGYWLIGLAVSVLFKFFFF